MTPTDLMRQRSLVVDIGLFNLLRRVGGVDPFLAKSGSVLVATTLTFLGNRSWTFGARARRRTSFAAVLFLAFNGVALLISLVCLGVSTYALGLTSPLAENVATNVVGLALGTAFRFWAYERWVFPAR